MCFGGGKKPQMPTPPEPAATPAPAPSPTEVATSAEQRRVGISAARRGMLSTIKTSPQGLVSVTEEEQKKKKALGA